MAYLILSTGSLTRSRLQTLSVRKLVLGGGTVFAIALLASAVIGFRLGRLLPASQESGEAAVPALLERPESRVLVDRIGVLSGRIIQLEGEAAALAQRIGALKTVENHIDSVPNRVPALPSGGPFVPASASPGRAELVTAGDPLGLQRLEVEVEQVAETLESLSLATAPRELATMAYPARMPIAGSPISSGFGVREDPFTGALARHTGIDFLAPGSTPIHAAGGGRVVYAGRKSAYGNVVEIDHGNGLKTRYAHASRIYVRVGDVVMPHQTIAAVGSTGRSTGPHLHFEVLRNGTPVEPRKFLVRDGV